jgi:hypothetical protein
VVTPVKPRSTNNPNCSLRKNQEVPAQFGAFDRRSFGDHSNTRALKTLANAWDLTGTELGKLKTVELSGVDFTSFPTWKQFGDGDR